MVPMTETTDRDALLTLLAPFPAEQIGKLPRGGIQLDYVGHADVTRRLLETDPTWQWEPLATDEHGLPALDTDAGDNPVGLWIRLTVCGVTRLGYGSCPSGQKDAVKVLIGDALRNAAMRFGVALDLWAKGDRADPSAENAMGSGGQAARRRPAARAPEPQWEQPPPEPVTDPDWANSLLQRITDVSSLGLLRGLYEEMDVKYQAGEVATDDQKRFVKVVAQRKAELEGNPA
jgi:hypothetical protein